MWLDEDSNRELLNHSLDAIEELCDKAHLHTTLYQQKVAQHYNKNIKVRTFKIERLGTTLSFPEYQRSRSKQVWPQLGRTYKITKVVGQGAYKIQAQDGHNIHNSWNAPYLKLYHL